MPRRGLFHQLGQQLEQLVQLLVLPGQHIRTCVADDLRAGSDEKLNELIKLLPRLMK